MKKWLLSILVCSIMLLVLTGCSSKSDDISNNFNDTSKKLKINDEMENDIEYLVNSIDNLEELTIIKDIIKEMVDPSNYESVEVVEQNLTDDYTYTVIFKANGINEEDYFNYKKIYYIEEDNTTSNGYVIKSTYTLD